MTRIKDNDFIFVRFVVIFIKSQEFIDPQIRIRSTGISIIKDNHNNA